MSGRSIYRNTEGTAQAKLANRMDAVERRRDVAGFYEIKVSADAGLPNAAALVTGNGQFILPIPFDLHRAKLKYVNAAITTVSSSGDVIVQIRNITGGYDMLTTRIRILQGDLDAEENTTSRWVIDNQIDDENDYPDYNSTVYFKQQLAIDVDSAGTGAFGLAVMLGLE